ncbi:MAG: hypothetical protein DRP71_17400 [Verrucomicrobia bacterium]|nr:MAG: hypothetical protein DRP71_17400 [Verrucomicrobiota bacterium]
MAAFPFCQSNLEIPRTYLFPKGYPATPNTLGEHIRKRRMDLGLTQAQVARLIGVTLMTVYGWERGRFTPATRHLPGVLRFLGEDPRAQVQGFAARLRAAREGLGLSQKGLGMRLGVHPSTVWHWEHGRTQPSIQFWPLILDLIGSDLAEPRATTGDRLLALRRARGVTQAELATELGLTQQGISEWERGLRQPPGRFEKWLQNQGIGRRA